MNKDNLRKNAEALYAQKKYADAVRSAMELIEADECTLDIFLLATKALLCLTATDNKASIWDLVYGTMNNVLDRMESYEQYLQVRHELLEACEEAQREFCINNLKTLEKQPTFDQFQQYNQAKLMHSIFCIKVSSEIEKHPKVAAFLAQQKKKHKDTLSNKFTEEEENRLAYDAGMRIFNKGKNSFNRNCNDDAGINYAFGQISVSCLLWEEATDKLKSEPEELRILRLEQNLKMINAVLNMRIYNGTTPLLNNTGMSEWRNKQNKVTKELNKIKKSQEEKKKKEEQARIAAYWKEHADEKAELEKELQEKEALRNQLSSSVGTLQLKLKNLDKEKTEKLPIQIERERQAHRVHLLETELEQCWFFQGKKKKMLKSTLDTEAIPKLEALKKQETDDLDAHKKKIDTQIAQIKQELHPKEKELKAVTTRINSIRSKLTKPI